MPLKLDEGWNQIQFNLADFCQRAYGTAFVEALRIQVHCSARLRRIFFCDRVYSDEELPSEYRIFLPRAGPREKYIIPAAAAPSSAAAAPADAAPAGASAEEQAADEEVLAISGEVAALEGPGAYPEDAVDEDGEEQAVA